MSIKKTDRKYYQKTSFRVTAGVLVVAMFSTIVLQSATSVKISRSEDEYKGAINYLVDNTEYVNKGGPLRVKDYFETLKTNETLEDYYRLAGTQIAKEEYQNALENIEKCIGLYKDEGQELYVDLLLKRGCLQVLMGDYDVALANLDLALQEDPGASEIYLVKAQIYAEREDMDALEQCLTAYLELKPEDSSTRELLAQIQFTKGDYQAAEQQYVEILSTDSNPQIQELNISSNMQEKEINLDSEADAAIGQLNTVSKAEIEYLYGLNAVRDSDFVTGEELLTSAIEKDDSFDGIYYYRGVCNMSLEQYAPAIQDLTASIEKEDMLQASYYTRGVCLIMDNQYEEGLVDIEHAASLNEDEEIKRQAQLLISQLQEAQLEQDQLKQDQMEIGETMIYGPIQRVEEIEPNEADKQEEGEHNLE